MTQKIRSFLVFMLISTCPFEINDTRIKVKKQRPPPTSYPWKRQLFFLGTYPLSSDSINEICNFIHHWVICCCHGDKTHDTRLFSDVVEENGYNAEQLDHLGSQQRLELLETGQIQKEIISMWVFVLVPPLPKASIPPQELKIATNWLILKGNYMIGNCCYIWENVD